MGVKQKIVKETMEAKKAEETVVLRVKELKKYFSIKSGFLIQKTVGYVKAVDGVSFEVKKGKTFGLVGESGCGKTTTGRSIIRLIKPTAGIIEFLGADIANMDDKELKPYRTKIQIVFQDPMSSLNPRLSIGEALSEPLLYHKRVNSKAEANVVIKDLLVKVGLKSYHIDRYPHQFSGGQRQRIALARAIILNPDLIVLDEPTSSLDVSVQAQIINLLLYLQKEMGMGYIFISHDLSVVRFISDEVGVMYLGRIVEYGRSDEIFTNPMHPYTKGLLAAAPIPDPKVKRSREDMITGKVPSPINRPKGCFFHPRCKYKKAICDSEYPPLVKVSDTHWVSCHLYV